MFACPAVKSFDFMDRDLVSSTKYFYNKKMTYPHLLFNDNSYFVQKKLGSEFVCEFLRRIIDMAAFNPSIQVKHFVTKSFI